MSVEFCVISIGALSHNRLWGETQPLRTAHATTTYIQTQERRILVDPSLPAAALAARFNERTGQHLSDITDVFCTTLRPVHRRSIEALRKATWWTSQQERESYQHQLETLLDSADRLSDSTEATEHDLKLLERFRPAPDAFDAQVSLYPLAGASAGSAGLLLSPPTMTLIVAGDAILTAEHLQRGQVWQGCADVEAATQSLQDVLDVADMIIPGHDNLILAPRQRWL